jgi:hypothetical protein
MGWDGGSSIVMYRTVVLPVVVVRCWLLRIVLRRQKICFEFYSKYRRSNTVNVSVMSFIAVKSEHFQFKFVLLRIIMQLQ